MSTEKPRVPLFRWLAEATAIFMGVTLGFLADDYRDYLNDRDQERQALGQLLQDLELDSADVYPMLAQSQWIGQATRWVTDRENPMANP